MLWTIDLACAVILMSLTGSICLFIWVLLGWVLERVGFMDIMYDILQITVLFFVVPIIWLILRINSNEIGRGRIFLHTEQILKFSEGFCVIWLTGAGIVLLIGIAAFLSLRKRYELNTCCDERAKGLFQKVCEEMHIPEGKVKLCQTYKVKLSELTGTLCPAVVISTEAESYTEEELRVIFVHELNHYRQRDIWIRYLLLAALTINFFNPAVWILYLLLQKYGEYACDDKSCRELGSGKTYCSVLFALSGGQVENRPYFSAKLAENGDKVKGRIKRIGRNRKYKRRNPWVAAVLCVAMLLGNTALVYAASDRFVHAYASWYDDTAVCKEEAPQVVEELTEYTDSGPSDDITVVEDNPFTGDRDFTWTVKSKYMNKTTAFRAASGGSIAVNVYIDPTNKTVSVGIVEPDGMRRYVNGSDSLHHEFVLDQTGSYQVFVENSNASSVEVDGIYLVR